MKSITTRYGSYTFSFHWLLVAAAAGMATAACSAMGESNQEADPAPSALHATGAGGAPGFHADAGAARSLIGAAGTSAVGEWTDGSGTIHVKLWRCDPVSGHTVNASCVADPGYVLVGGGAELSPHGSGPGPLLVASYPDADLRTWRATAKDHLLSYTTFLRAWALGMRLDGVSEASLRSQTHYVQKVSGTSSHPTATATVPAGDLLVGGGARATYNGAGLLLMASTGNSQWYAEAKDHGTADTGTVTSYAIGVKQCPTGYAGCLTQVVFQSSGPGSGYGYQTSSVAASGPYVMTSIGGASVSSPYVYGRLLNEMYPQLTGRGSIVWTKDHWFAEAGSAISQAVALAKQ